MHSLIRLPLFALFLVLPFALAACSDQPTTGASSVTPPAEVAAPDAHEMPDGTMMSDDETMMSDDEMDHGNMNGMADGVASARMVDGVQVVEIEAGRMGYAPKQVALEAGVPARLVFTRTVESECSSQVKIPAFDVPVTDLPLNEPVAVEFTPTESGTFEFVCGMDMQRGSLMIRS
jgi:hypothetical protein